MINVSIIGAGLAGCEVAWQLCKAGINVTLFEMKPEKFSKAHKSPDFAELVCSNSFKSKQTSTASGLLKKEMELLGSLTLEVANSCSVEAGDALAVNREIFAKEITKRIKAQKNIKIITKEVEEIPQGIIVIATGPLTSECLTKTLENKIGCEKLAYYDAIAPIVYGDSIDKSRSFFASRYDNSKKDYLNCPMNKEEYEDFYENLISAKTVALHSFDKPKFFEGCMPIEIMAKRGKDTMRFGPLKPVGLFDPTTSSKFYAVVQLRKENLNGSLFNMVGFQTNLTYSEQKRVFRTIPALKNAEFLRYGTMHKNIFINSPSLLNQDLSLKKDENIFFAGQITGVEGYMESAATGILVGKILTEKLLHNKKFNLPQTSMIASLVRYITNNQNSNNFQPMAANFALLPSLEHPIKNRNEKRQALATRAILDIENDG